MIDTTLPTLSVLAIASIISWSHSEAALAPALFAKSFKAAAVSPSGGASVSGGVALGAAAAPALPASSNFQKLAVDVAGIKGLVRNTAGVLPNALFSAAASFRKRAVDMDMASIVRFERSPRIRIPGSEILQGVQEGVNTAQAITGTRR